MADKIGNSLHITWDELACKDGSSYPSAFVLDGRVIELVVMFEKIRFVCGGPIKINSAYRTETYNASVGGASNSMHKQGKALDLQPPWGMTVDEFHSILRERYEEFGIRGLGKYKTFVHCDIRNSTKLIEWNG